MEIAKKEDTLYIEEESSISQMQEDADFIKQNYLPDYVEAVRKPASNGCLGDTRAAVLADLISANIMYGSAAVRAVMG